MTLLQFFNKYAPPNDGNNPVAYANAVAKNLGVSANATIGQLDAFSLAAEIARHEDGNSFRMLNDLGIISQKPVSQGAMNNLQGDYAKSTL